MPFSAFFFSYALVCPTLNLHTFFVLNKLWECYHFKNIQTIPRPFEPYIVESTKFVISPIVSKVFHYDWRMEYEVVRIWEIIRYWDRNSWYHDYKHCMKNSFKKMYVDIKAQWVKRKTVFLLFSRKLSCTESYVL